MKGLPLAIYRRLCRTGDERRVGHVVLKKYLSRFAWTGWSYCTYHRKFVILCCVWLYCSCYSACLYCVSSCRTVSSLSLKYSIEEFASRDIEEQPDLLHLEKWFFSFDRSNMQIFTVNITRVVRPHVTNLLDHWYFCQHNPLFYHLDLISWHYWS